MLILILKHSKYDSRTLYFHAATAILLTYKQCRLFDAAANGKYVFIVFGSVLARAPNIICFIQNIFICWWGSSSGCLMHLSRYWFLSSAFRYNNRYINSRKLLYELERRQPYHNSCFHTSFSAPTNARLDIINSFYSHGNIIEAIWKQHSMTSTEKRTHTHH